ncbi:MAG TPA: MFS transporter [Bryobacteraceae bacterium]|nr:MFS transporter [Bryobacteraceae bacterium]
MSSPKTTRSDLRSLLAVRAADELSLQMLSVGTTWYLYSATRDPMSLAYAGLAQLLPNMGFALLAGRAADRFPARKVISLAFLIQAVCLAIFTVNLTVTSPSPHAIYLLLFLLAGARAFSSPAISALLPHVAGAGQLPRAVASASSVLQICTLLGPVAAGLLFAVSAPGMFAAVTALSVSGMALASQLVTCEVHHIEDQGALGGIRYVWTDRLLRALLSLDLAAMLLGGVTALLPVYARDILRVGPAGLGWLRCAPSAGAAIVGLILTRRAIRRSVGTLLLICVAGFGLATMVFAVSTRFWLSLASLTAAGAFDMVSMVVRETVVQTSTPSGLRGRVNAIHGVFIGVSSELGAFESGAVAAWVGAVPAAFLGGVGTLLVVGIWSRLFPEISRTGQLCEAPPENARAA